MEGQHKMTVTDSSGCVFADLGVPRDPAVIVAEVIADVRDREGKVMVGRATRKKAARVLEALRAEGWRVLR